MSKIGMATKKGLMIVRHDPSQSRHECELGISAIRSHAARIQHSRRHRSPSNKRFRRTDCRVEVIDEAPERKEISTVRNSKKRGQRRLSPLSLTKFGEHDPFDSLAIRVTSEVSALLCLWTTHCEGNAMAATRWMSECDIRQDLDLHDELHAKSLLFTCSALVSSRLAHRCDLEIRRLEHKHETLQQLKYATMSKSMASGQALIHTLSLVFIASVLSNEVTEAKLHAEHFWNILVACPWVDLKKQISTIARMYYYDDQCALMYMRPPVLQTGTVIRLWDSYLAPIRSWLGVQQLVPGTVTYPAFSKNLAKLFKRLQDYVNIQCEGISEISLTSKEHALSSPLIYTVQLTCLFFGHLELVKRLAGAYEAGSRQARRWKFETILSLAALAFLTCASYGPSISDRRERGSKVMQALRNAINQDSCDGQRSETYQQAQLWALYIGAVWEWDSGAFLLGDMWFTSRLQEECRDQHIESWSHLKAIVDGFLRVPAKQEHGAVWFPGMDGPSGNLTSGDRQISTQSLQATLFPGCIQLPRQTQPIAPALGSWTSGDRKPLQGTSPHRAWRHSA